MIIEESDFLTEEEVKNIRSEFSRAPWIEGSVTAGTNAREVKNNLQIDRNNTSCVVIDQYISAAFMRSKLLQSSLFVKRVSVPLYARYEPGMKYGEHVDRSVMGRMRTDLAATIFLSDPEEYDGGLLMVQDYFGTPSIKLKAGAIVVYPATSIHEVSAVTRGTRDVAVLWLESAVRSHENRRILWELTQVRDSLQGKEIKPETQTSLGFVLHNLIRQWVET